MVKADSERALAEVERSQQELRACIEQTRRLAEQSDGLVHKHRASGETAGKTSMPLAERE